MFFSQLLRDQRCHIHDAGGREECLKLAAELRANDHAYVVVVDGDYDILTRRRSSHRRLVSLDRYSIENYLFECEVLERVAQTYSRTDPGEQLIGSSFDELLGAIKLELRQFVILDVAHQSIHSGVKLKLNSAEQLMKGKSGIVLDKEAISKMCAEAEGQITREALKRADDLVTAFVEQRRLVDLLRGHVMFGFLWRLLVVIVKKRTGRQPRVDKNPLLTLLASETWRSMRHSPDHKNLKRRILNAVQDVRNASTA